MRKKNKETIECDKSMLCEIGIIKCEKKKGTIKCDKSKVACDIGTTQYKDSTIKCEKKIRKLSNVTKVQSHVMLVLRFVRLIP